MKNVGEIMVKIKVTAKWVENFRSVVENSRCNK